MVFSKCGAPAHHLVCFLSVQVVFIVTVLCIRASYRTLSSNTRVRDLLPRRMNSLKNDAVSSKNKKAAEYA